MIVFCNYCLSYRMHSSSSSSFFLFFLICWNYFSHLLIINQEAEKERCFQVETLRSKLVYILNDSYIFTFKQFHYLRFERISVALLSCHIYCRRRLDRN